MRSSRILSVFVPVFVAALALGHSVRSWAEDPPAQGLPGISEKDFRTLVEEMPQRIREFTEIIEPAARALGHPEVAFYGGTARDIAFFVRARLAEFIARGVSDPVAEFRKQGPYALLEITARRSSSDIDIISNAGESLAIRLTEKLPPSGKFFRWEVKPWSKLEEAVETGQGRITASKVILGNLPSSLSRRALDWSAEGIGDIHRGQIRYLRNPRYFQDSPYYRTGTHDEFFEATHALRFLNQYEEVSPAPDTLEAIRDVLDSALKRSEEIRRRISLESGQNGRQRPNLFTRRMREYLGKLFEYSVDGPKTSRMVAELGLDRLMDKLDLMDAYQWARFVAETDRKTWKRSIRDSLGSEITTPYTKPPEQVHHYTNLTGLDRILVGGFKPSVDGQAGPGLYAAGDPESSRAFRKESTHLVTLDVHPERARVLDVASPEGKRFWKAFEKQYGRDYNRLAREFGYNMILYDRRGSRDGKPGEPGAVWYLITSRSAITNYDSTSAWSGLMYRLRRSNPEEQHRALAELGRRIDAGEITLDPNTAKDLVRALLFGPPGLSRSSSGAVVGDSKVAMEHVVGETREAVRGLLGRLKVPFSTEIFSLMYDPVPEKIAALQRIRSVQGVSRYDHLELADYLQAAARFAFEQAGAVRDAKDDSLHRLRVESYQILDGIYWMYPRDLLLDLMRRGTMESRTAFLKTWNRDLAALGENFVYNFNHPMTGYARPSYVETLTEIYREAQPKDNWQRSEFQEFRQELLQALRKTGNGSRAALLALENDPLAGQTQAIREFRWSQMDRLDRSQNFTTAVEISRKVMGQLAELSRAESSDPALAEFQKEARTFLGDSELMQRYLLPILENGDKLRREAAQALKRDYPAWERQSRRASPWGSPEADFSVFRTNFIRETVLEVLRQMDQKGEWTKPWHQEFKRIAYDLIAMTYREDLAKPFQEKDAAMRQEILTELVERNRYYLSEGMKPLKGLDDAMDREVLETIRGRQTPKDGLQARIPEQLVRHAGKSGTSMAQAGAATDTNPKERTFAERRTPMNRLQRAAAVVAATLGLGVGAQADEAPKEPRRVQAQELALAAETNREVNLHYKLLGPTNGETIVLIHGLDSAQQTFSTVADELAKNYQVLLYDQRGHGQSEAKGEDYSSERMARDLDRLLTQLGIEKANLLGHSMGARTAVRFAQLFPERTQSVIVEDMEMLARTKLSAEDEREVRQTAERVREQFRNPTFPSREALVKVLTPYYGGEALSLTRRRAKENPDGTITLLFRPEVSFLYGTQGNQEDLSTALRELKAPILFIQADPKAGSAMTKQGVSHIRDTLPAAPIRMIQEAGHTIHRTHPGEFLQLVNEFLTASAAVPSGQKARFMQSQNRALAATRARDRADDAEVRLNYKLLGSEHAETVVLIHGLSASQQTFDNIVDTLAQRYRVLVYDQRGHGDSEARGEDYSSERMARDLAGLMKRLGIEKAHVLGHSMGARAAVRFAELHPERVQSVIVEDMEMFSREELSPKQQEMLGEFARELRSKFPDATFASREDLVTQLKPYFGQQAESLAQYTVRENPNGSVTLLVRPEAYVLRGSQGNAEDLTEALRSIKVPTLFIQADPTVGSGISREGILHIRSVLPNAQLRRIQGAGHYIHASHPQELLQIVNDFLGNSALQGPRRVQTQNLALVAEQRLPQISVEGETPFFSDRQVRLKGADGTVYEFDEATKTWQATALLAENVQEAADAVSKTRYLLFPDGRIEKIGSRGARTTIYDPTGTDTLSHHRATQIQMDGSTLYAMFSDGQVKVFQGNGWEQLGTPKDTRSNQQFAVSNDEIYIRVQDGWILKFRKTSGGDPSRGSFSWLTKDQRFKKIAASDGKLVGVLQDGKLAEHTGGGSFRVVEGLDGVIDVTASGGRFYITKATENANRILSYDGRNLQERGEVPAGYRVQFLTAEGNLDRLAPFEPRVEGPPGKGTVSEGGPPGNPPRDPNAPYEPLNDKAGANELAAKFGDFLTIKTHQIAPDKRKVILGREAELQDMVDTLLRMEKMNAVLVAEPGVGKTAIIELLAQRIVEGNVPEQLRNAEILKISARTFKGNEDQKLQAVKDLVDAAKEVQAKTGKPIILYYDELHSIARIKGVMDELKQFMDRRDIYFIGASTHDEVRELKKDRAFERRFNEILVEEPSMEMTVKILKDSWGPRLEQWYGIKITEDAIRTAVEMNRYQPNRFRPDGPQDILMDAAVRVFTKEIPGDGILTADGVKEFMARRTKLPLSTVSAENLDKYRTLPEVLGSEIYNQPEAIQAAVDALRGKAQRFSNLEEPAKVTFMGLTGTGKTELGREVARAVYGDADRVHVINFNEIKDLAALNKEIGSPQGFKDSENMGALIKFLDKNPAGVIILDEFQQADPQVREFFRGLLDKGEVQAGDGSIRRAKEFLVVITTNAGQDLLVLRRNSGEMIGPTQDDSELTRRYEEAVKKPGTLEEALRKAGFSDPLIQRMGKLVLMRPHTPESLKRVAEKNLQALADRTASNRNIKLTFTEELKEFLGRRGYNFENGARQVSTTVKELVESNLSRLDLQEKLTKGQSLEVGVRRAQIRGDSDQIVIRETASGREFQFEVPKTASERERSLAQGQRDKLLRFEDEMSKVVIGQPEAVRALGQALGSKNSQLAARTEGPAVVTLIGTTATGKTHAANALAKYWYRDGKAVLDFNMATVSDLAHFNILTGSAPGYVGYKEGASLADFIDRYPNGGVIVLNEFEKAGMRADRDGIYGKLFDILAEGKFIGGDTRERTLKNHIIVVTMNAGDRDLFKLGNVPGDLITHEYLERQYEQIKPADVDAMLRGYFSDPLIRRLKSTGEPVVMRPLSREALEKIATNRLKEIAASAQTNGNVGISFSDSLVRAIVSASTPWEGAGPVLRRIESLVRGNLADVELRLGLAEGDTLRIDYDPTAEEVLFSKATAKKDASEVLRYRANLGNTVSAEAEERLQQALEKIPAEYRPERESIRITTSRGLEALGGVWVGGVYMPLIDKIVMSESHLRQTPVETIAEILVHENVHRKDFLAAKDTVTPEQYATMIGRNPGLFEWTAYRVAARVALEQGWSLFSTNDEKVLELSRDEFVRKYNESMSYQLRKEDVRSPNGRPFSESERRAWLRSVEDIAQAVKDIKFVARNLDLANEFRHEADPVQAKARTEKVVENFRAQQMAVTATAEQPRAPTEVAASVDGSGRYYERPEYRQGIERIANELQKNNSFLIITDVQRPDGDTLGSGLALAEELRRAGKEVDIFSARDLRNSRFSSLPGFDRITDRVTDVGRYDAIITVDFDGIERTGLRSKLAEAQNIIRIDHHKSSKDKFAHIDFEVPEAAATGELVYDVLKRFRGNLSQETARNLYTAILTDSHFRYEDTSPRTLAIAAELAETGNVKPAEYFREYAALTFSAAEMKLVQDALATMKVSPSQGIVSIYLTKDMLRGREATGSVRYGLLDLARSMNEAKVAVVYTEQAPGRFTITLRSEQGIDVSRIARELGGGGHFGAAGTLMEGTIDQVTRKVERAIANEMGRAPQTQLLFEAIFDERSQPGEGSTTKKEILEWVQSELDARALARAIGVELDGKPTHYRPFEGEQSTWGGYRDPVAGDIHINTDGFNPQNLAVLHEIDHERQAELLGNQEFGRRYNELRSRQEEILEPIIDEARSRLTGLSDSEIDQRIEPYKMALGEKVMAILDRDAKIRLLAEKEASDLRPDAVNPYELSAEAFRRGMQTYLAGAARDGEGHLRVDQELMWKQLRKIAVQQAEAWRSYGEANADDSTARLYAVDGIRSAMALLASGRPVEELRQLARTAAIPGAEAMSKQDLVRAFATTYSAELDLWARTRSGENLPGLSAFEQETPQDRITALRQIVQSNPQNREVFSGAVSGIRQEYISWLEGKSDSELRELGQLYQLKDAKKANRDRLVENLSAALAYAELGIDASAKLPLGQRIGQWAMGLRSQRQQAPSVQPKALAKADLAIGQFSTRRDASNVVPRTERSQTAVDVDAAVEQQIEGWREYLRDNATDSQAKQRAFLGIQDAYEQLAARESLASLRELGQDFGVPDAQSASREKLTQGIAKMFAEAEVGIVESKTGVPELAEMTTRGRVQTMSRTLAGATSAGEGPRVVQGRSLTAPLEEVAARIEGRPVPQNLDWTLVFGGNRARQGGAESGTIQVTVDTGRGTVTRTVPYRPGMTALQAVAAAEGYLVETTNRDPVHRAAIDRIGAVGTDVSGGRFWMYDVNGKHPDQMPNEYLLEPGSQVRFSYRTAPEHRETLEARAREIADSVTPPRPQGVKGHSKQFARGMGTWLAALPIADMGTAVIQGRAGDIPGQLAAMAQPESLAMLGLNYGSFALAAEGVQYPMTRLAAQAANRAAAQALAKASGAGLEKAAAEMAAKKTAALAFKNIARFAGPAGFFAGSAVADIVTTGHLDVERWMVGGLAFLGVHAALSATVAPLLVAGLGLSATGIGATVGVPILILAGTMIAVSAIEMAYDYFKAHPEVLINAAKAVREGFETAGKAIAGGFKKAGDAIGDGVKGAGNFVKKGWKKLFGG